MRVLIYTCATFLQDVDVRLATHAGVHSAQQAMQMAHDNLVEGGRCMSLDEAKPYAEMLENATRAMNKNLKQIRNFTASRRRQTDHDFHDESTRFHKRKHSGRRAGWGGALISSHGSQQQSSDGHQTAKQSTPRRGATASVATNGRDGYAPKPWEGLTMTSSHAIDHTKQVYAKASIFVRSAYVCATPSLHAAHAGRRVLVCMQPADRAAAL